MLIEAAQNYIHLPTIDLALYLIRTLLSVCFHKVLGDPRNEVIFEGAFDNLVQEIPGDEFIYVGTRKITGKGL